MKQWEGLATQIVTGVRICVVVHAIRDQELLGEGFVMVIIEYEYTSPILINLESIIDLVL